MSYTFGTASSTSRHRDAVEVEIPPASPVPSGEDPTSARIGERIAALVPDGATVQAGVGAVRDVALAGLVTRTGLRNWAEIFSDDLGALLGAGALTPSPTSWRRSCSVPPTRARGRTATSGRLARTERTNDPRADQADSRVGPGPTSAPS
jgi:hypothetical protein